MFELASGTLLAAMGLLLITGHESLVMTPRAALAAPSAATPFTTPVPVPATCNAGFSPAPQALEASSAVAAEGMPTMLEFVAAGCPICRRMHSVVAAAEHDCSQHGIRVRQVDVSTTEGRAAASKNSVLGVPTFLFLDGAGKEVARLVGEQPLPVLIQSLEVLVGEKCDGFSPMTVPPAPGS